MLFSTEDYFLRAPIKSFSYLLVSIYFKYGCPVLRQCNCCVLLNFFPLTGPCGVKRVYVSWSPLIVGGMYAKAGEWPWQVQLGYFDISESIPHICGASILDHYWIVTAAHCVKSQFKERPASNFNVTVGRYFEHPPPPPLTG